MARLTICCSGCTRTPLNPSTSCGPSSTLKALIFLATVDPYHRPSLSPHPSPHSAYPPPSYYLPLEPEVTGAAKEYDLNFAESVLERNESPLLERVESTRGLLLLESVLGRDSGTGGVGATPDAAFTENREDINIFLAIENLEYR